jgi:hypothetical protein
LAGEVKFDVVDVVAGVTVTDESAIVNELPPLLLRIRKVSVDPATGLA